MERKKSYIPVKVFVSYLVLAALVVGVSVMLYSENVFFSETEQKIASENSKILKVSTLLSHVYETESLARITIQSDNPADFKNYTKETNALMLQIDSMKILVKSNYQEKLLDSVKLLLARKTNNILQLKDIKSKASDEIKVKSAINDLTRMELSLRKLSIEDFVKNPASLGAYQKSVLEKYVDYLNQNIPNDSSNTLSQKALDSMLTASKTLLNDVKRETSKRNQLLNNEEKKLLQNELSISAQLRKILVVIEREIIANTTRNNEEKENTLKKIIKIVTIAAAVGFLLTLFFSLLILNDFSKTQSYKNQLEEANSRAKNLLKNREQLISTVSHDLKTPLNTIVGYTELLGNAELTAKQLYYNKNIKGASEYISRLVQDLLDFTQIEAGKIVVENIPFSLADSINDVSHSVQSVYSDKKIDLQIIIDKRFKEQRIIGDPFRLQQILTNIIGNAFKFTAGGFIKVTAGIDRDLIAIVIEDSGIGIEKDKQKLVFEEFTQADTQIEKKYGGTGLGLTISKKMTEILGGRLTLESTVGKGSTFRIELPLVIDSTIPVLAQTKQSDKKLTAIVLDDDQNLLKLTTEILQQQYTVFAFTNAAEALEAMKTMPFDFVVTDIQMPEIDGFAFLKILRATTDFNLKQQPIIAVTGKSDADREIYTSAGFTTVIKKPYSPKALLETIEAILKYGFSGNRSHAPAQSENVLNGYSLTSLKSFMPNDDKALREVLASFINNTKESLFALETAVKESNEDQIQMVAHRMSPMFRQISADHIASLLDQLEKGPFEQSRTNDFLRELKAKIAALFEALEKELIV